MQVLHPKVVCSETCSMDGRFQLKVLCQQNDSLCSSNTFYLVPTTILPALPAKTTSMPPPSAAKTTQRQRNRIPLLRLAQRNSYPEPARSSHQETWKHLETQGPTTEHGGLATRSIPLCVSAHPRVSERFFFLLAC